MSDIYKIDPETLRRKMSEGSEQQVITLKDDSTKPPPTISTASWQGILCGPVLGQPTHYSETPSRLSVYICRGLVLGVLLLGIACIIRTLSHG